MFVKIIIESAVLYGPPFFRTMDPCLRRHVIFSSRKLSLNLNREITNFTYLLNRSSCYIRSNPWLSQQHNFHIVSYNAWHSWTVKCRLRCCSALWKPLRMISHIFSPTVFLLPSLRFLDFRRSGMIYYSLNLWALVRNLDSLWWEI